MQKHYNRSLLFFNRTWSELVIEQGNPTSDSNYWIGLEKLNLLTTNGRYKLRLDLQDVNETWYWEEYNMFIVGDSSSNYRLTLSGYTGNTGPKADRSKEWSNGMMFTTYDRDNDKSKVNCARSQGGGWWYNNCAYHNLNGSPGGYFRLHSSNSSKDIHLSSSVMRLICQ